MLRCNSNRGEPLLFHPRLRAPLERGPAQQASMASGNPTGFPRGQNGPLGCGPASMPPQIAAGVPDDFPFRCTQMESGEPARDVPKTCPRRKPERAQDPRRSGRGESS